jgi:hypothetical protein
MNTTDVTEALEDTIKNIVVDEKHSNDVDKKTGQNIE